MTKQPIESTEGADPSTCGKWQPIETAPKDTVTAFSFHRYGKKILAYPVFGEIGIVRWWQSERRPDSCNFIADGGNAAHPTHWMPLPSPPSD